MAHMTPGANKTRGAAIKNQLNTEIAACDKKQKEQEHKHAHDASHGVQGRLKKKMTGPYVVGWFLGSQKSTRVGQIFLGELFIVVLKSKIEKKSVLDFLSIFL
jgi:hypothetical protein